MVACKAGKFSERLLVEYLSLIQMSLIVPSLLRRVLDFMASSQQPAGPASLQNFDWLAQ